MIANQDFGDSDMNGNGKVCWLPSSVSMTSVKNRLNRQHNSKTLEFVFKTGKNNEADISVFRQTILL